MNTQKMTFSSFIKTHWKTIVFLGLLLIGIALANEFADSYLRRILNLCAIYTIVSLGMNLVNGFTGQFSLGQAGFMAIGAYTVAIFTVPVEMRASVFYLEPMAPFLANIELPFIGALILGGIFSALVAFLIGYPCLRLRGDYLAIATLGFSEIIRIIFTNTQTITNGALGIKGIPTISNLWWTYGIALLVIIATILLVNSSYGRAFKSIREDEIAAEAMGIGLFKTKMTSFMIGAFFTGIAGGLFAALLGTVDPKQFYFTLTYNFLLIIVLGGMGSISGTIISSFIVTIGLEWLRFLDEPMAFGLDLPIFRPGFRMVIFSLLLMIIVLFYRKGLMGTNELTWDFIRKKIRSIQSRLGRKTSIDGGEKK
ncbi:MAG: branched-chain amino acid transport system permease protein [Eubacteriaceae bacterium]|jgi:branched-chain amino acid transport system permease protein|nr:branched-chain amino acid transport system permease protein [Eubacteriaceae bacterium]MDK2904050.1 branched-chain amino acid transport system permease protein [Eubacteriaceae bacterium]MDK2935572.1 branched-chain amino acid transport system permease protein [Eubacteriaceae bacterium]MDK2961793.1 branched-chain amino acid transport system permease protein [Eubacteriaceae bacterium]MDN5306717.1 branched-chain amino acid transport system permease protein [Eubacteriaceae bacterium]